MNESNLLASNRMNESKASDETQDKKTIYDEFFSLCLTEKIPIVEKCTLLDDNSTFHIDGTDVSVRFKNFMATFTPSGKREVIIVFPPSTGKQPHPTRFTETFEVDLTGRKLPIVFYLATTEHRNKPSFLRQMYTSKRFDMKLVTDDKSEIGAHFLIMNTASSKFDEVEIRVQGCAQDWLQIVESIYGVCHEPLSIGAAKIVIDFNITCLMDIAEDTMFKYVDKKNVVKVLQYSKGCPALSAKCRYLLSQMSALEYIAQKP